MSAQRQISANDLYKLKLCLAGHGKGSLGGTAVSRRLRQRNFAKVVGLNPQRRALLSFAGGAYKVFMFHELAKVPTTSALSRGGWGALGAFEMLCAILLIVPTAAKWVPVLTPLAAAALAGEPGP
jgi:DoxX-like family